jgi:3D (Asp-Asp-Asp) domain-containing protein
MRNRLWDRWFEIRWLFSKDNKNSIPSRWDRWVKLHIIDDWPFGGLMVLALVIWMGNTAWASETWTITAYCSCVKCCGKSDGITASGKKAKYGMVACNWLKFGTKVNIAGLGIFKVQDRGARSLFGSAKNHIKHLDVYMPSHSQALKFGKQYKIVEVIQ